MDDKKYHKELPGGGLEIDFSDRPLKLDGTDVKKLVMREPTVEDQITVQKTSDGIEAEIALLANLIEQDPQQVRGLTMRQYGRLQAAYEDFLS